MVELILGTVQLGIDYGINNKIGKPNAEKAFEILDYAYNNGISILDTASSYGNSEEIIGNYIKETQNNFNITTKLAPVSNSLDLYEFVSSQIDSSLDNLSKQSIDLYLIHNFKDVISNDNLINILINFKNEGKLKNFGVSLYEPFELEYLLNNHVNEIDFVQIPFNLLDSRWVNNDLLKKTKDAGIKIYVRSVFLQGLIFIEEESELDKIDLSLKKYLKYFKNLTINKNISMSRLAIDYIRAYEEIDGILVGCETIDQLKENIKDFNEELSITDYDKREIINLTKDISEKIIDPRKW